MTQEGLKALRTSLLIYVTLITIAIILIGSFDSIQRSSFKKGCMAAKLEEKREEDLSWSQFNKIKDTCDFLELTGN